MYFDIMQTCPQTKIDCGNENKAPGICQIAWKFDSGIIVETLFPQLNPQNGKMLRVRTMSEGLRTRNRMKNITFKQSPSDMSFGQLICMPWNIHDRSIVSGNFAVEINMQKVTGYLCMILPYATKQSMCKSIFKKTRLLFLNGLVTTISIS